MQRPRWKLWHLFAITTFAAVCFGLLSLVDIHTEDAITLISLLGLFVTIIFEHKMPQWISLMIAAACIMWLAAWAMLPDVQ